MLQQSDPRGQEGMGVTPEIMLFIGGGVLTVIVTIVLVVFLVRILRAERVAEQNREEGGA